MKILHVISSGGMYGAEAVILDLARSLRRAGHTCLLGVFANAARRNTELEVRAAAEGLETHLIPCSGQMDRTVPGRLRDLVRSTNSDVVHSHGYKADVYAYWALRGADTPLVATCHNWIDAGVALRLYGVLDRRALRRFAAVIAVSEGVRRRLIAGGVSRDKVHLIRNGVDLQPFAGIKRAPAANEAADGPFTVGLVARLSHEKGVDLFLQAAAGVVEHVPGTRFVVGGDGPDRGTLHKLLEELHLGQRAQLAGRQDDMPAFYAGLDVLVLSSRQEGMPMALLEGMASGLPIVATTVGEVPQVVLEGETGLLVPPENPVALADAVTELLRTPERFREMGRRGRARVTQEFSADQMATAYLEVYKQVCHGSGTNAVGM